MALEVRSEELWAGTHHRDLQLSHDRMRKKMLALLYVNTLLDSMNWLAFAI